MAIVIAGLLGYIPEMIFTIVDMTLIGLGAYLPFIIPKAWVEIIIITALMAVLFNYKVIKDSIDNLMGEKPEVGRTEYLISGLVFLGTFISTFILYIIVSGAPFQNIAILLIGSIIAFAAILAVILYLHFKKREP